MRLLPRFALLLWLALGSETGRTAEPADRPVSISSLHLVFAEEYSLSLISGFGHVFACIPDVAATNRADLLLAPSVNFGVDLSSRGDGVRWARYTVQPCFELVRQNSLFQQRRLLFFEIELPDAQLALLAEELERRLDGRHPYDFLRRNCGYYLCDWLAVVSPRIRSRLPRAGYLTPRDAVDLVLEALPVKAVHVIPSPVELAVERAEELGMRGANLPGWGPLSLSAVQACPDAELQLHLLSILASRASPEEHARIETFRRERLATEAGRAGARASLLREQRPALPPGLAWPRNGEGALTAVGAVRHQGHAGPQTRMHLRLEAGLRGEDTPPVTADTLRSIRMLAVETDTDGEKHRPRLTVIEYETTRDIRGLPGGGGNGLGLLYDERASRLALDGLAVDLWWGPATRISRHVWTGVRAHGILDRLERDPSARVAGEWMGAVQAEPWFAKALVSLEPGQPAGCRLQVSRQLGSGWFGEFSHERDPRGVRDTLALVGRRF